MCASGSMPYLEPDSAGCACASTRPGSRIPSGKERVCRAESCVSAALSTESSTAAMRSPRSATAPAPSCPVAGERTRPAWMTRSYGVSGCVFIRLSWRIWVQTASATLWKVARLTTAAQTPLEIDVSSSGPARRTAAGALYSAGTRADSPEASRVSTPAGAHWSSRGEGKMRGEMRKGNSVPLPHPQKRLVLARFVTALGVRSSRPATPQSAFRRFRAPPAR